MFASNTEINFDILSSHPTNEVEMTVTGSVTTERANSAAFKSISSFSVIAFLNYLLVTRSLGESFIHSLTLLQRRHMITNSLLSK